MPGTRPRTAVESSVFIPASSLTLLAAVGAHACQVTLKCTAFAHLEAVSPEIVRKCDLAPIQRLSRPFTRTQLQTFALHAGWRRNDPSAILHRAPARDFVVNIFTPRVDILRRQRSGGRDNQKTGDCESERSRFH